MLKRKHLLLALAGLAAFMTAPGFAAEPERDRDRNQEQTQTQDRFIYGSQLMTAEERTQHRAKLRAAKTWQEREQIRNEHHEQMKLRAKAKGVTLPDEPPAAGKGGGMGPGGAGMGAGMGPGGGGMGMGGGAGRGR
jgi:hypothetical protein